LFRNSPSLFHQGAPFYRFIFFLILSGVFIFSDYKLHATEQIRALGQTLLSPIQVLLARPGELAASTSEYFSSRSAMREQLTKQSEQIENLSLLANQAQYLDAENTQLKKMLNLQQKSHYKTIAAEIIYNPINPASQKIIINLGEADGVKPGMPIASDLGIMGQIIRVYPNTSEVALLEERDFSIPVLVERNGLRAALFGVGRSESLELRYINNLADLDVGDYLNTSGIDGTYPPGLPVAIITKIDRTSEGNGTIVSCRPLASLNHYRYLMVLVYSPNTQAPTPTESETIKNRTKQKKGGA
jgi:rod shape-determining protein MreC